MTPIELTLRLRFESISIGPVFTPRAMHGTLPIRSQAINATHVSFSDVISNMLDNFKHQNIYWKLDLIKLILELISISKTNQFQLIKQGINYYIIIIW